MAFFVVTIGRGGFVPLLSGVVCDTSDVSIWVKFVFRGNKMNSSGVYFCGHPHDDNRLIIESLTNLLYDEKTAFWPLGSRSVSFLFAK